MSTNAVNRQIFQLLFIVPGKTLWLEGCSIPSLRDAGVMLLLNSISRNN